MNWRMEQYLAESEFIDWRDPGILAQAAALGQGVEDPLEFTRRSFEWVRDEVRHSGDYALNPVTCRASDVLKHRTGFCYAKSHLLAALLRARSIPAGLCYQRLVLDDAAGPYCLHGLMAVHLPRFGWYRLDPRGNRPDIDAQCTPPRERLAFKPTHPGETDLPEIWPEPLGIVVAALQKSRTYAEALKNLPDIAWADWT